MTEGMEQNEGEHNLEPQKFVVTVIYLQRLSIRDIYAYILLVTSGAIVI
jgi:hypothetical protein